MIKSEFRLKSKRNAFYTIMGAMIFVMIFMESCHEKPTLMKANIDIQGHRGCRGLRPENTISGFLKAIDLGVHTLELDVIVNKYNDVIVSHEGYFNHEISTGPDGLVINKDNEKDFKLYEMTVEQIQSFDVGLKPHSRFPQQKKVAAVKPTLSEMVNAVEAHVKENNYDSPHYNIEIKRVKEEDGILHPDMETFADVVCNEIINLKLDKRSTVQCFDIETLQYVHKAFPDLELCLLIANQKPFEQNLAELGFKPAIYSPYFKLVSKKLMDYSDEENIKVIPWTVNDESDINAMIEMGVDGIISDYPDRVVELVAAHQLKTNQSN